MTTRDRSHAARTDATPQPHTPHPPPPPPKKSLPTVSTGAPLHPHTALPGTSPKGHGEGRPETDTLTVSSRTTPRNKNTGKTSPLSLNDANQHSAAHAERHEHPHR